MRHLATGLIVTCLFVTSAIADDFNPPPWRGLPLTVEVEWDFEYGNPTPPPSSTGIDPDYFNSVAGSGGETLSTYYTHIDGNGSYIPDPDGTGPKGAGFNFSGFAVHVANWIDFEPYKDIRIQLTGYVLQGGDPGTAPDWVLENGLGSTYDPTGQVDWGPTGSGYEYDPTTGIIRAWNDYRLWPNPDYETFILDGIPSEIVIDQVYVDTISTPEPGTLAIFAAAGLLLRRKR